ncbi:uncharacterized protein LOC111705084 isoform X2 [Eurytemora carolleeae]|uniref:uncharacterized protein LOC111705084 isoform X2 n=1 Tax=Eurytemora carolleeae TaxID=1294199 RepID=UPI000C77F3F6|nr:uncharacterized protein LOC111705084 isoform X2 [Eurytemora carolleeae]|eukprot:XP_023333289.1 uncharacterized protein LOC111705084 isoform X2 [Eurytemora affinis]
MLSRIFYWKLLISQFLLFTDAARVNRKQCTPTQNDVEGPFFVENAPTETAIAPEAQLRDATEAVKIFGQVLDKACNPIEGATVDIWYAGKDKSGNKVAYTFPPNYLWFRGQTQSKKEGVYEFQATFPGVYDARPIVHYHIKSVLSESVSTTGCPTKNDIG